MRYHLVPALLLLTAPLAAQAPADWQPAPAFLAKGAQIAVLQGDPGAAGVYTIRLKLPEGYVIAPHFHPTDEQVTVISGHLLIGMGDTVDRFKARRLSAGDYATAPAQSHHYAIAADPTIVQIHGAGPFMITYAHGSEDPRSELAGH